MKKDKSLFSILVIEDDRPMLEALTTILHEEGYQVLGAENGRAALELLQKPEVKKPDIILLDMIMPEMDGWTFAGEYGEHFHGKTAIIVLTAAAEPALRARDIRADAFLAKPYELEELFELLERFTVGGEETKTSVEGVRPVPPGE